MQDWFPLMLRLGGRKCLIAGGGRVAERRAESLLSCGALVTIVSPEVTGTLRDWERQGKLEFRQRAYETGDLAGMFLAVAATGDPETNRKIRDEAGAANVLVNRADEPETGDFAVPATVRRGKLVMAVTTSGASPSLAASIRAMLEIQYGEEYETLLDFLHDVRLKLKKSVKDLEQRRRLLNALPIEDMLAVIRTGQFAEWRSRWLEWAERNPDSPVPHVRSS